MADLLFLGDIDVVDTWKDIKQVLAQQIDGLATLEQPAASINASSSVVNSSSSAPAALQQAASSQEDDLSGFEISDARGAPTVDPDNLELTPEDRGIFTRGERRKYRLSGIVCVRVCMCVCVCVCVCVRVSCVCVVFASTGSIVMGTQHHTLAHTHAQALS